ncbi:ROK family transcriptional regulator [Amycolatopsis nigrescens]|uniref:ROK family transcriptional regulator n=1 Tax=Amycolatopsis nigrescens TaxID=381445 RepID=UPI00039CFB22|nr:ROK family transcriptional regulator [Amycolatopsis nigrescens]
MTTLLPVPAGGALRAPGVRESNAAAVLAAARLAGPLSRASIAARTELSMPTVSRQVAALVEAGLLHELPELATAGSIGRPRVPVDVNDRVIAACGVHVGVSTTTYGLADLRGRLLDSERVATPAGPPGEAFAQLAGRIRAFLRRWSDRRVVGIGLATGGRVDAVNGLLDHDRLGWRRVPARELLASATGLPVHLDGHVPAMATAELLFGPWNQPRSLLYFYARQVVGIALAMDGRLHRGPGPDGSVAHLPVGGDEPCPCGRTGCLEVTVAEETVVRKAFQAGVIPEPRISMLQAAADAGEPEAVRLLDERANTLGRAVAMLRDIVNPDLIVLGGQAVTDSPSRFGELLRGFAGRTALPGTDLVTVTRFGQDVQAIAACTGVLRQLYDYPFGTLAS